MSVNKFKVGDVVKCVDSGVYTGITKGKEYDVVKLLGDDTVVVRDNIGEESHYYSYRFELSKGTSTTPPKFKEGDMVYLIGFDCLKPCKLIPIVNNQFEVETHNGKVHMFTENGLYTEEDFTPSIVLATEENRQMLNKLLGVEYEPVKLTGSDLAKKLLKHNPQTCYVSDISDERASSKGCIDLIVKFDGGVFVSSRCLVWNNAVPCDQHGTVLMDE